MAKLRVRTERDKTGHLLPRGNLPAAGLAVVWRDEVDLYMRPNGAPDEAARKRLYRWRRSGDLYWRKGDDGRLQIGCDPEDPARPVRCNEQRASSAETTWSADQRRHLELERKLRTMPTLDEFVARRRRDPTMTLDEWAELGYLREKLGCGEEFGDGPPTIFVMPLGRIDSEGDYPGISTAAGKQLNGPNRTRRRRPTRRAPT